MHKKYSILVAVGLLCSLSGCIALVVGAAAGGTAGYVISKDEDQHASR